MSFLRRKYYKEALPIVYEVKKFWKTNSAIILTFSVKYRPDYVHFGDHIRMKA